MNSLYDACRYFERKTGFASMEVLEQMEQLSMEKKIEVLIEMADNVAPDEFESNPEIVLEFVEKYSKLERESS